MNRKNELIALCLSCLLAISPVWALAETAEEMPAIPEGVEVEGMDSDEGAKAIGIRPGTFRVRLNRGRNMLRELLKGEGINV